MKFKLFMIFIILKMMVLLNCKSSQVIKESNDKKLSLKLSLQGDSLIYSICNNSKSTNYKIPPSYLVTEGWGCNYFDKSMNIINSNRYLPDADPSRQTIYLKPDSTIKYTTYIYDQLGYGNIKLKADYYIQYNIIENETFKSNLLKINFDPAKNPRWYPEKDGPMLEPIKIDTTNAEYFGIWIKNNNRKRKLKLKDIEIICDTIEDIHGYISCDTKSIKNYNGIELNNILEDIFVIKVPRAFLKELKVFDRVRAGGLIIYHDEDKDNMISIHRKLNKFESH